MLHQPHYYQHAPDACCAVDKLRVTFLSGYILIWNCHGEYFDQVYPEPDGGSSTSSVEPYFERTLTYFIAPYHFLNSDSFWSVKPTYYPRHEPCVVDLGLCVLKH